MVDTPGERLKEARKSAGFASAADAAQAIKIPYPTYAGHENNSRGLIRNIDRYARFFGVNPQWLRMGTGAMKPGKKPEIIELYEELTPEKRVEAMGYLRYLRDR